MCPVRFIPLYLLHGIYEDTGCKEKALEVAKKIHIKPLKVISPEVLKIKHEITKKYNFSTDFSVHE